MGTTGVAIRRSAEVGRAGRFPPLTSGYRPEVTVQSEGADQPRYGWARVEMAVGVLMQLGGWDAPMARSRQRSADRSDVPVVTAAGAILGLFP